MANQPVILLYHTVETRNLGTSLKNNVMLLEFWVVNYDVKLWLIVPIEWQGTTSRKVAVSGTDNMQGSRRAQLEDCRSRDKHASRDVRLLLLEPKLFIMTNLALEENQRGSTICCKTRKRLKWVEKKWVLLLNVNSWPVCGNTRK